MNEPCVTPVGVHCFENGRATMNLADDAAPFLHASLRRGYPFRAPRGRIVSREFHIPVIVNG
jgi:hypothetical protein